MKTGARGGDDAEEFYIDPRDGASVPKNTALSKHQQGREAVLRMMSKQKKKAAQRTRRTIISAPSHRRRKLHQRLHPKVNFLPFTNTFDQRRITATPLVSAGRTRRKNRERRWRPAPEVMVAFRIFIGKKKKSKISTTSFRYRRTTTIVRREGEPKLKTSSFSKRRKRDKKTTVSYTRQRQLYKRI